MNLLSKNFIILYLIVCVLGAFAFHWFFIDKMMTASECLSSNCVYSSTQTIVPPETMNILLIALLAILIALILPFVISLDNNYIKIPGRMFIKWKIEGFCRKLISWLKILEKRDPQTALIAARISDFSQ
jgi:hypothetical protein